MSPVLPCLPVFRGLASAAVLSVLVKSHPGCLGNAVQLTSGFAMKPLRFVALHPPFEDTRYSVPAGEYPAALLPAGRRAPYAAKLLYYGIRIQAASEGQGQEPAHGLELAHRASACLAHRHKYLERQAVLVFIYRYIEVPAACRYLSGSAYSNIRPWPRAYLCSG